VKIKSLWGLFEAIARDIGGKEAKELLGDLDKKLPGSTLSLRQLIGHLDTRLVGVLRVDEKRSFTWPGEDKLTVPGIDLFLSVDDLSVLFDAYEEMLRILPGAKITVEGDMHWFEFDLGVPGAAWLKPVLAKNAKSGRLFVATSKSFVEEFLRDKAAAKTELAQAPDWKRATSRFMPEANALTFMSGAFLPKVARFVRPLAKGNETMQTSVDLILDLLPEGGIPFAAQQVSLPGGLYYASCATTSHKSTLFPALVATPLVVATVAASALTSYTRAARALAGTKPSIDEVPLPERGTEEEGPAEQKKGAP